MHVLLDLYGVLLDHEKMFRGYRERLAELLTARFGGDPDAWRRAHDEAWVTYVQRVNAADWESRGYREATSTWSMTSMRVTWWRCSTAPV
jgi:FMN phosphatase YigB (HAD superfamily)